MSWSQPTTVGRTNGCESWVLCMAVVITVVKNLRQGLWAMTANVLEHQASHLF